MTLTSHAIVGAAVASLVPQHPILGVVVAFASHFAVDAIPHWDYPIASSSINPHMAAKMKYDKAFLLDVVRIGSDALLGLFVSLWFFSAKISPLVIFIAVFFAMLPDPLQFAYSRFKHEPLVSLQRFHEWIHTSYRFRNAKVAGIISQIFFIIVVISLARYLF